MTTISIRERGITTDQPVIAIAGQEYPITISDPFGAEDEELLEWYYEEHLKFPFTDQVPAAKAAQSIATYGEALFDQVFQDRNAYTCYKTALQAGIETLTFEIAGSPNFHQRHWEALKDPDFPQPLALQATFVRRNLRPQNLQAIVRESPTINLLVVTARPALGQDVAYRTISRPLVDALRQTDIPIQIDILRPGTYEALVNHLEAIQDQHGTGYYHVIHFDVHGALLTFAEFEKWEQALQASPYTYPHTFQEVRYGRPKLSAYEGQKGFLLLEKDQAGLADPVEATELVNLLTTHQIPVAILNACQSGKQVGESETSLGSQLLQAGMQMVLAMRYSVTVSAAQLMMERLYEQLFAGTDLSRAIGRARLELYNQKERRVYFNQTIELEDWLLPVVYQNQPLALQPRAFTTNEQVAYYERMATRYPEPAVSYTFVGRDLDILQIERRLLTQAATTQNILLIRGMGGAGKTTLLHHLGYWWQATGFVEEVFYFGYDSTAWTHQQIIDQMARQLLGEVGYISQFQPLSPQAQQSFLAQKLRATRHLLILDNLESITGSQLAILKTLSDQEQQAFHSFVQSLRGGKTVVLLGSRSGEAWLGPGTFEQNVYGLAGLDSEATANLVDEILKRHGATHHREAPELRQLLKLLDGYPLALEVVLANLAHQTPGEILAALQAGDVNLDNSDARDKTESILQCIAYSHSNLSPESQQLLLCLTPFVGVILRDGLPRYTQQLQEQPALSQLPFDRWDEVIQAAMNWGLLTPDSNIPNFLRIQPILPYFLQNRVAQQPALQLAIEIAFRQHYSEYGEELNTLIMSQNIREKQLGQVFTQLEYANLYQALQLALKEKTKISGIYMVMDRFIEIIQEHSRGVELGQSILLALDAISPEYLTDEQRFDLMRVLGDLGRRQGFLNQYSDAYIAYQHALNLVDSFIDRTGKQKFIWRATVYHELGKVAHKQRQMELAEQHYNQALEIFVEFKEHSHLARTYYEIGNMALDQSQWKLAESHTNKALKMFVELKDFNHQARTYYQLGMIAQMQQQWSYAKQNYQNALEFFIKCKDHRNQASVYHQLGIVAQSDKQLKEAIRYYTQALKFFIKFKDDYNQACTYHQLGMVEYKQQHWKQAEQYYRQALEIHIELEEYYGQADIYHELGRLMQAQDEYQNAEFCYQKTLQIYTKFDERYKQAGTYGQLGLLAEAQVQWAQARDYLLEALTNFVAFEDGHNATITIRNLARLWRDGDDPTLAAAVAGVVGLTEEEVVARFEKVLG